MKSVCLLALLSAAWAQQDPAWLRMTESKTQVKAWMERAAQRVTARAAEEVASRDSWEGVRARRLEEMREMLGLLPWPARTPLNARVTGVLDQGSYRVEKIAFESMPKIYVTGNLYVPKDARGAPGVIYVCGHAYSPYGDKTKYQRHGISLARNGYAAFILDSIQIAETFGLHHGTGMQEMYDWYARGYSPAGVETWNAMRAIDYLETRPEVDKSRIGMTGRSGGAAMTWFTAAVDPRVKAAVPVMGISTYAANVRLNTQRLHCDCMFPINALLHDMMHQGALIAPRPLLMAHGRKDDLFPVPGYEEFERRIGALYASYGRGDDFRNLVVETGHQDSDYLREQAIRWFDRHLLGKPDRSLDMSYKDAPDAELAVFPQGPPADAQNYRVHETFLKTPAFSPCRTRQAWEKRRGQLLDLIRNKVFAAFALPPDPFPLRTATRKPPKVESPLPGLIYVASDGEDERSINALLGGVNRRNASVRLTVYPRGVNEVPWEKSFWKDVLRSAMHIGHTVDSMRLLDVLQAVRQLRTEPGVDPQRITVMGAGQSAALALYAAILDDKIDQVLLVSPPDTHSAGPVFLNILRYTDLPEAAALVAPRPLNFYARIPPAYEAARHVWRLYDKPANFFLTMQIEGVVEGRRKHDFASGL